MKTKPKKFTHYLIVESTLETRPGYEAILYKASGDFETTFAKTKTQIEKDVAFQMSLDL